jgi:hypothetical protein
MKICSSCLLWSGIYTQASLICRVCEGVRCAAHMRADLCRSCSEQQTSNNGNNFIRQFFPEKKEFNKFFKRYT